MICHNCGSDNKEGYKFCSKCGTKLLEENQTSKYAFSDEMYKISAAVSRFESEKTTPLNVSDDIENEEKMILNQPSDILEDFENDETVILDQEVDINGDFENDETVILDQNPDVTNDFENDETVILSESKNDFSDFENEETVILDQNPGITDDFENDETVTLSESGTDISDFENDETVILNDSGTDISDFENDETVILDDKKTMVIDDGDVKTKDHSKNKKEAPSTAPTFDYRSVYKEYRTSDSEETAYIDHLRRLKELLDDGIITEDEFTRKKQQILGI